jgi:hypothetical protein
MADKRCGGGRTAVVLLAAVVAPGACAGQPPPSSAPQPVSLSFLEYLGASDPAGPADRSAGGGWMRYLSQLKLGPSKPAAPAPGKTSAPPGNRAPAQPQGSG